MAIAFYAEDITLPPIKKRAVSNWVKTVAETYGKKTGDISYIFCSDEKILEVNRQYLQHDYYTDIISLIIQKEIKSPEIFSSAWIPSRVIPRLSIPIIMKNCTGPLSMASCTYAASTIKARANGKSWRPTKTRLSPCCPKNVSNPINKRPIPGIQPRVPAPQWRPGPL